MCKVSDPLFYNLSMTSRIPSHVHRHIRAMHTKMDVNIEQLQDLPYHQTDVNWATDCVILKRARRSA